MKPGIKTSEFWIATIATAASLAGLLGVIGPDQQAAVVEGGNHIVAGVREIILGITTLAPVAYYIRSRTQVKIQDILSNAGRR
jgi:hypothetical protein